MGVLDGVFDKSDKKALLNADKGFSGTKIEESMVVLCKVVMAKQVDSGSSASKNFKIELETEAGAKLYWDAGWYIGKKGDNLDSKGNLLLAAASLARANYIITGEEDLPQVNPATIKEYNWDTKQEDSVERQVAHSMIGKFVYVQTVRIRSNKQVDSGNKDANGYAVYVDSNTEKFTNSVKRFYDAETKQTFGEKMLKEAAEGIVKDIEYCEKNLVLDKFKEVAEVASAAESTPSTSATAGFGS